MKTEPTNPPAAAAPEADLTAMIDVLLDDLAATASRDDVTSRDFFAKMASSVESLFDSQWMAVWALNSNRTASQSGQSGTADSLMAVFASSKSAEASVNLMQENRELRAWVFSAGSHQPGSHQPKAELKGDRDSRTHVSKAIMTGTDAFLATKIDANPHPAAVMVTRFPPDMSIAPLIPVFDALGEIATRFISERSQANHIQRTEQLMQFALHAHLSLRPREVATHIANDARIILGCERVMVFQITANRPKLMAVSSVATPEHRSKLIQKATRLVTSACRFGQPFFAEQRPSEPPLARDLDEFVAASEFPFIAGIPLPVVPQSHGRLAGQRKPKLVGFLIAESDETIDRLGFSRSLPSLLPQISLAMSNARRVSQMPFRRSLSLLGKARDAVGLSSLVLGFLVACVGVFLLFLMKTDFLVPLEGELRPEIERSIFAPADGFVERVTVDYGDGVRKDQPLIELSSPRLNLELEELSSEQTKIDKKLESKRIALNQATNSGTGDMVTVGQLASEISQLEHEEESLVERRAFLQERIDELVIPSPIDGRVTTWQLKRTLLQKPVRWGDELAKVADESGKWQLIFAVPEYRIGYLLDAQKMSDAPVEIEFFFESNPARRYRTHISAIASSTETDIATGPFVTVTCPMPSRPVSDGVRKSEGDGGRSQAAGSPQELIAMRHGARVIAEAYCGKRPVIASWTQELTDSIRRKLVW